MLRRASIAATLFFAGCNATGGEQNPPAASCQDALRVLVQRCAECHKSGAQAPYLDAADINMLPATMAELIVRKVDGTQSPAEGQRMPPGVVLADDELATLHAWMDAGAPVDCTPPDVTPDRHHPNDWADPAMHGLGFELAEENCRDCHAQDFTGQIGPSCDSCHMSGWREKCTYCHGGTVNDTGAPPRDLGNELENLTFAAHTSHVSAQNHAPFDCIECHNKPTDVTSSGHVLDDTKAMAEVVFGNGRSSEGNYLGSGSCENLYCHGDGKGPNGSWAQDRGTPTCNDCHATTMYAARLGGEHGEHLREGFICADCHGGTVNDAYEIVGIDLHVNGQVDLALPGTITWNAGTCTGTCHGEGHNGRRW